MDIFQREDIFYTYLFSFCFTYKNAANKLMYFAMKNRK